MVTTEYKQYPPQETEDIVCTYIYDKPCKICDTPKQFYEYGSYEYCEVCGWQDDAYQYKYPDDTGANKHLTFNEYKARWESGETLKPRYPNPQDRKNVVVQTSPNLTHAHA